MKRYSGESPSTSLNFLYLFIFSCNNPGKLGNLKPWHFKNWHNLFFWRMLRIVVDWLSTDYGNENTFYNVKWW